MWTCTSSGGRQFGMTLLDLLMGMTLTLVLAAAVAPVWLSLQAQAVASGDHVVSLLQSRVAVARWERDVRLATAEGPGHSGCSPLLEADGAHVVMLTGSGKDGARELVEWEIVDGSMMRRRVEWPGLPPAHVTHSLFTDHKTMLEGLQGIAGFTYFAGGRKLSETLGETDLAAVDTICLEIEVRAQGPRRGGAVPVTASAEVGR